MYWKNFIIVFGYLQSVGMSIVMLMIFFTAYFNKDYRTLVLINYFGEAHIEAVMVSVVIVFIFSGLYILLRNFRYIEVGEY